MASSLTDFLLSSDEKKTAPIAATSSDGQSLTDTILSGEPIKPETLKAFNLKEEAANNRNSFVRGMRDILDTGAHGLARATSAVADTVLPEKYALPIRQSKDEMLTADKAERDSYDAKNPGFDLGRTTGQVLATAPLMPMRLMKGVQGAMGALPTISATGAKVAAPFLNRAAAASVTGGLGGAEYGALTASSNDKSTIQNTGEGLITGAIGGPILTMAGSAGKATLPTLRNLWANVEIGKIARNANMDASSVKNVLQIIEDAGFTPQQAQKELNKLGPSATLSDLASSISTEASGLASFGGKPTEILKGRFEARSKTANSAAHDVMEAKLGPKPEIEAEKEAIIKKAQLDTGPDYKAAHVNSTALDIQPVVNSIDKQLETAVGPKAAALKELKGFLFKNVKDASGKDIKVLKHRVDELHEVRQAIDDVINDKNPTTSYGKNALNSIKNVRNGIDAELKTIPEMSAADSKFAEKMDLVNHIKLGEEVLKRNGMNKEEFAKFYDALSPEKQEAVRKGMRSHLGDLMESATRGELSEAQRLFGKSSLNRANLEKAFGNKGTEVLDALQKEATERATENAVRHGAQTAERQAIQRKYGERNDKSPASDIVHGIMADVVTGSPALATTIATVKRAGSHAKLAISTNAKDRMIEGTADIISRQGTERNNAVDILTRVRSVQDKIKRNSSSIKLPTLNIPLLSAPIAQNSYSGYRQLKSE